MEYKILIILILFYLLLRQNNLFSMSEGFNSTQEIKEKSMELFDNKEVLKPSSSYTTAKKYINWLDPVTFADASMLSKKNKFTISNLENIFYK